MHFVFWGEFGRWFCFVLYLLSWGGGSGVLIVSNILHGFNSITVLGLGFVHIHLGILESVSISIRICLSSMCKKGLQVTENDMCKGKTVL